PHVNTTRSLGETSTYSPRATSCPVTFTRKIPPGRGSRSASTPIQRTMCSGSTKNLKMTSGGASMRISRSTGSCSSWTATATSSTLGAPDTIVRFGRGLQPREALAPELVEIPTELVETLGTNPVQAAGPVPALVEHPRVLEDPEMLRDRRTWNLEVRRDRAGAQLMVADEAKDLTTSGYGERACSGIHACYVSRCLRSCQGGTWRQAPVCSSEASGARPFRSRSVMRRSTIDCH